MKIIQAFVLLVCVFILAIIWLLKASSSDNEGEYLKDVTFQIKDIFKSLDINNDGYLDTAEFSALQNYKIFQSNKKQEPPNSEIQTFPTLQSNVGDQIIYLETAFKPLELKSLKKNISSFPEDEIGSLIGLINWTTPYKKGHPFSCKSFSLFLPQAADQKIGEPWWIIKPQLQKYSQPISSNRYYPPTVDKKYHPLFAMLSLFHPHPFLYSRFMPQGTAAVIRAISDNFYDIIFRIHAEFQLNKPPLYPFWFTPSQFSGQIIINRDASVIKYFEMHVPYRKLNVDMEWLNGPSEKNMEVDIGHIPHMALVPLSISAAHKSNAGATENLAHITWNKEMSIDDALSAIETHFFPFKEVKYHSMPTAFDKAQAESKLVHGIVLWGNLDDQSC